MAITSLKLPTASCITASSNWGKSSPGPKNPRSPPSYPLRPGIVEEISFLDLGTKSREYLRRNSFRFSLSVSSSIRHDFSRSPRNKNQKKNTSSFSMIFVKSTKFSLKQERALPRRQFFCVEMFSRSAIENRVPFEFGMESSHSV